MISLTVRGQEFSLYSPFLYVENVDGFGTSWKITTSADIHTQPGFEANSPWGSFATGGLSAGYFNLLSSLGFSLPDTSLPTQLNIADWSGGHQIFLAKNFGDSGGSGGYTNGTFALDAEITSITLAPEPGTMAILGLG